MIDAFTEALRYGNGTVPKGISLCGAMADLVPPATIAAVTELLRAPYLNSFGSTETGLPPATRSLIPIGIAPARLSKRQNSFCEIKLVDPVDNEVAPGEPGELAMRGATLFSGYWQADETNAHDFRGGWFHMGDVFPPQRGWHSRFRRSLQVFDQERWRERVSGGNRAPAPDRHEDPRGRCCARAGFEMGRGSGGFRRLP